MTDPVFEVGRTATVSTSAMRAHSSAALWATQKPLSILRERVGDRHRMPGFVGPKLAVVFHRIPPSSHTLSGCDDERK